VERAGALQAAARDALVAALGNVARGGSDWRARVHALWTLDGIDAISPDVVQTALADRSRDVRTAAIRAAERWLGTPDHPIQKAVLARVDDADWSVRQQLTASLGALPDGAREEALVTMVERYGEDPIVM